MEQAQLSARERRFAEAFLESGNPAAAAAAAGYQAERAAAAGEKLLARPAVQETLRKAWKTRPRVRTVTKNAILQELAAIAFSDFTDYVRVEDGQVLITESRDLDYSRRAAIAGIKDTGKGVEIKLHDKQKALELLVKYLGLFEETDAEDKSLRVVFDCPEEWTE